MGDRDSVSFHTISSDTRLTPLQKYQLVHVGRPGLWPLCKCELLTLLVGDLPGLTGLFLRQKLYRLLLGRMGRRVVLGRGLALRQPSKITIDDDTVVDDHCVRTVCGSEPGGITIGKQVFVPPRPRAARPVHI